MVCTALYNTDDRDSDIRKLREAETDTSALQARCHELEGMLRAREKICREQADSIKWVILYSH